jgi:cellulose synthase/poly-beta-1,6-N-acetylglucosamine synthase-like glycosyltransferase
MSDLFFIPLTVLYLLVVSALFIYGINFFYMVYLTWKRRKTAVSVPPDMADWPLVTVQLPIYNEMYVAERVINAVARLDYPGDRLQIQVLDDSTDETVGIVKTAVDQWRAKGINIVHLTRSNREGYKAGALRAGLQQADGEFIAIFDADFVPQPDYLRRVLPTFRPHTAFVQARWGHLNQDYSLLTALQSIAIDAHFVVEQFARSMGGFWFNFNGTAGVWRRAALEDAGGWQADTLTEDLDLSYRALLRGWGARYLRHLVVPAELPVSMVAFRRQQHRWARGSLECALKLGPQVWRADIPLRLKLEATLHLTGYAVHLLLFALSLLYPAVLLMAQQYPQLVTLFGIAYVFNLTALAPTAFFVVGQRELAQQWWRKLPKIFFITAVGSGLMINTLRAALQIITRQHNAFERTAKFGIERKEQSWTQKQYQLRLDSIVFWELGFAALNMLTVLLAFRMDNWAIAFYAGIFLIGLLYVSGVTIYQAIAVYRQQRTRYTALSRQPSPAGD